MQIAAHLSHRKWNPHFEISGLEGIENALAEGKGVIIWCDQLTSQIVMGKRALWEAGIVGHKVSVAEHGLSHSLFGKRFLNPLMVNVENRFLATRVVFERDEPHQVTARIRSLLADNQIVLISANVYSGGTFMEAQLGEKGWVQFASTPANFAARDLTALFSMRIVEATPFERYLVEISPRMNQPEVSKERRGRDLVRQAELVLLKRDYLLAAIKTAPDQFMSWWRVSESWRASERELFECAPNRQAESSEVAS